jgi:transcriptional regulator with XRE-family HTH domain
MKTLMRVERTITVDAPGLGKKIKKARESDGRKLTDICSAVGMTAANWYRIEAEKQVLPEATLRKIEYVLKIDLGVSFDD